MFLTYASYRTSSELNEIEEIGSQTLEPSEMIITEVKIQMEKSMKKVISQIQKEIILEIKYIKEDTNKIIDQLRKVMNTKNTIIGEK